MKLTLVGAGPGDPELITLKGIKALETADVVLYDALANDALLIYARQAKVIEFVGKRRGAHSLSQDAINESIVFHARKYGHVVRLKGGDPFVYGRGFEELEYAARFGIPWEVTPGVSSATSLGGLLDIPLTHRDVSRSFHVFTATVSDGRLNPEVRQSVHLTGTRVILMGLRKLNQIVELYRKHGLGTLPVAVIQNGSLEQQRAAFGTIDTILAEIEIHQVKSPAIILIGEVVALRNILSHEPEKQLVSSISEGPSIAVPHRGRRLRLRGKAELPAEKQSGDDRHHRRSHDPGGSVHGD